MSNNNIEIFEIQIDKLIHDNDSDQLEHMVTEYELLGHGESERKWECLDLDDEETVDGDSGEWAKQYYERNRKGDL